MKVAQCPTDELSLTNCAVTHPDDIDAEKYRHIVVKSEGKDYHFSIRNHNYVKPGTIGFSAPLRKWAVLSINQPIMVRSYKVDASRQNINQVAFTVDTLSKKIFKLQCCKISQRSHITLTRWLQSWPCSLHRLVWHWHWSANCLSDARQETPYTDSQRDSSDSL
ncbi:NSF [Bugula neritina]|uniref:Vesicle-fusing ATPase n=1 Tax=Bugula neritina TaxID=10212 RepID=A0A7J7K644_BUGNE|nr:NSF [Bugula neritina]